MDTKILIGVDNGVTGCVGIIYPNKKASCFRSPVKKHRNYTKEEKNLNRIDTPKLKELLISELHGNKDVIVVLERPMVSPARFSATLSAIRALEATLIVLEELDLPYQFIDSREWQGSLLPTGTKGENLKVESKKLALELFPHLVKQFKKDGDGILIAEYIRRKNLKEL